jgi:nicotinamidase-related amidase
MHRNTEALQNHTILLLIMPQEDFHPPSGSLQVPGAREDSARTATLIKENYHAIDEIIVLQDSHHVRS